MATYNKVIKKSLLSNIPRFFMCGLSCFLSKPKAISLPLRAEIENGVGCNLKCKMCAINNMKRKRGFLTFEKFKIIYDQINPPYCNLTGYTESFLNKDIFKMIKYAKSKGSFVKMDSNATIMNKKIIRQIIDSGLDSISISIDGATQKTYGKIRVGGKLKDVLSNLKELTRQKKEERSNLNIFIAIIVQKENLNEIIDTIKLLDGIGADEINLVPITEYDIKEYEKFTLEECIGDLKKIIDKISNLRTKTKVNFEDLLRYLRDYKNKNLTCEKEVCYAPWYDVYVTWEGDVVPCCYFYDNQLCFGNIFKEDFEKIWNNKAYQNFRKSMAQSRRFKICQTCRSEHSFLEDKFKILRKIPLIKNISNRN